MQVNMLESKSQLSSLIVAAERGEELLIAHDGKPIARILPCSPPQVKPPGAWKGLAPYSTHWRSPEIDQEVERLFAGDDDAPAA